MVNPVALKNTNHRPAYSTARNYLCICRSSAQSAMVGTFDYNKVPVIKAFLVFLFPANVKISKNCSRSVQYRWYKDQQKFHQEIYTYLGNLLSVLPLIERPA